MRRPWYQDQMNLRTIDEARRKGHADRKQAIEEADVLRKKLLAEEKIRRGIDQARQTRTELHKVLKKPGGVQDLLNQSERWHAQITSARADWQRASDLMAHAEGSLDLAWTGLLKRVSTTILPAIKPITNWHSVSKKSALTWPLWSMGNSITPKQNGRIRNSLRKPA